VNRHVVEVDPLRERASATPERLKRTSPNEPGAEGRRPPVSTRSRENAPLSRLGERVDTLRELQLWFARAVMTPDGAGAAATRDDANRVLTRGPRLQALDRLEIYRRAYQARLIECLVDDYPVLRNAIGEGPFEDLCRAYIERHPSDGPNLNSFGRHMEHFCRESEPSSSPLRHFAAELAALEWAIVEVIHAPSSEPLTLASLRDVPMDAWAAARLVPNSAFRLLRFVTPVNEYFQAVREGKNPPIPSAFPSATIVYRSGATVWRMDLTASMFDVLSALVAGETLGASLSRAEASFGAIDEQEATQRVLTWFREWMGSGLFVRVEVDERG
jgi:hypothetical protein